MCGVGCSVVPIMEDIQAGTHWRGSRGGRPCRREMRAPDTGLGGAAAMAARWPEIGRAAEQNASLGLIPHPGGCTQGTRA